MDVVVLPTGWERESLQTALEGADLAYRFHDFQLGVPWAGLYYGPTHDESVHLRLTVSPGSMRVVADDLVKADVPTDSQLQHAQAQTNDGGSGRLFFDPVRKAFCGAVTLFAFPGFTPSGEQVRWAAEHLLALKNAMGKGELFSDVPAAETQDSGPQTTLQRVAEWFEESGFPLSADDSGGWSGEFYTDDDGSFELTVRTGRAGVIEVEAAPLSGRGWSEDREAMLRVQDLNSRLMKGAVVVLEDGRAVWRHTVPASWLDVASPWPMLIVDRASWAVLDIVRVGRGGPIARPNPA